MSKRKTINEFKNEIKQIFGDKVEVLGNYVNSQTKILVRFTECGHEEMKTPTKLLTGQECGKCKGKRISRIKTKTQDVVKQQLLDRNLELLSEYIGSHEKILVRNLKCGHTYMAQPNNIINRNSGCPVCYGHKDLEGFKKKIQELYPNEYSVLGNYKNNRTKILVRHNKCGCKWEVTPKDLLRDRRCPQCIRSKGEDYIAKFLEENKFNYKTEYRIKECKNKQALPFDFMVEINGEKRLIEFDGSQHFSESSWKRQNSQVKINDEIKNNYCKQNNIKLLRIPYWWLRNDRIDRELKKFLEV